MKIARALTTLLLFAAAATGFAAAQTGLLISPDVPTNPDGTTRLPWEVVRYVSGGSSYASELTVPGNPAVNGVHRMDQPGGWLISVEARNTLGGSGTNAEPRDVVRLDQTTGATSLYLDGSCLPDPFPAGANIDAVSQDGGDNGPLLLAFAAPTTVGGVVYQPNQVLKFVTGGGGACDWTLARTWDLATLSTTYHPASARITGLHFRENAFMLVSFDIPVALAPGTGPTPYLPGQIARWDFSAQSWSLDTDLRTGTSPGWPLGSEADGLGAEDVPLQQLNGSLMLGKSTTGLTAQCPGTCSGVAERFGLYEGTLQALRSGTYDHRQISCAGTCPGDRDFNPGGGDRYYLLVTHNGNEEGAHGQNSNGVPRPRPGAELDRCAPYQVLGACP